MNGFLKFFTSKNGFVCVGALILLSFVLLLNPSNPLINFIARVGNLLIFGYILWKAAGKALIDALSGRRKKIAADLQDMETRRHEAEQHLKDLEKSLSDIAEQRAAILDEARHQAEAIKANLIAKAEADAQSIVERAKKQAASQAENQLASLRAELADSMAKELEALLRTKLTSGQHASLIEKSLKKVVLK